MSHIYKVSVRLFRERTNLIRGVRESYVMPVTLRVVATLPVGEGVGAEPEGSLCGTLAYVVAMAKCAGREREVGNHAMNRQEWR